MSNLINSLKSFKVNESGKQELLLDTNLQVRTRGRLFNCFYSFNKDKVAGKIHQAVQTYFERNYVSQDFVEIKRNLEKFKAKLTAHVNKDKKSKEFTSAIASLTKTIALIDSKLNPNKETKKSKKAEVAVSPKKAETSPPSPIKSEVKKLDNVKSVAAKKNANVTDPQQLLIDALSTAINTSKTKKKGLSFEEAAKKLVEMLKKTIEERYKNFKFDRFSICDAGLNVTFSEKATNGGLEFLPPKTYPIPRNKIENLENLQTLKVGGIEINVLAHLKASELFQKQQKN